MNSFFYPTPGNKRFHTNTWETWNKLKSPNSKKKISLKRISKKSSNNYFVNLDELINESPQKVVNPFKIKKPVEYIKYNRNKSEISIDELMQQGQNLFIVPSSASKVNKKTTFSKSFFDFGNMQLQGTRIVSRENSSRPRPVSIKSVNKPRARSFTTVKKFHKNEDLETPTPW